MRYTGALKCVKWVRKLNRYYGMDVKLRSFDMKEAAEKAMRRTGGLAWETVSPRAELVPKRIWLPRTDVVMIPWVVAHEYAHLVQWESGLLDWRNPHDKRFQRIYAECCMVLGIAPTFSDEWVGEIQLAMKRELGLGDG